LLELICCVDRSYNHNKKLFRKEVQSWQNVLFVIKAYTSVTQSVIHIDVQTNNGNLTLERLELLLADNQRNLTFAPNVYVQVKSNVLRKPFITKKAFSKTRSTEICYWLFSCPNLFQHRSTPTHQNNRLCWLWYG